MSNYSMIQNNQANKYIDNTINYYQNAYNIIEKNNNNDSTKNILSLIDKEIVELNKIKTKINSINREISIQLQKNGSDSK